MSYAKCVVVADGHAERQLAGLGDADDRVAVHLARRAAERDERVEVRAAVDGHARRAGRRRSSTGMSRYHGRVRGRRHRRRHRRSRRPSRPRATRLLGRRRDAVRRSASSIAPSRSSVIVATNSPSLFVDVDRVASRSGSARLERLAGFLRRARPRRGRSSSTIVTWPWSAAGRTSADSVLRRSVITTSPVPDRCMSYAGCCGPCCVFCVRPSVVLVRELVGLGERDHAVAVAIGSAAQRGDEEVREERRADAVGLLRVLVGRARRQEREALDLVRAVAQERRHLRAALHPREAARRAAVDDRDVDVGGHGANALAQPRVVVARAADQDAGLVGVPRVVDDELDALAALALVAHALRRAHRTRCRATRLSGSLEQREVGLRRRRRAAAARRRRSSASWPA